MATRNCSIRVASQMMLRATCVKAKKKIMNQSQATPEFAYSKHVDFEISIIIPSRSIPIER